MMISLIKILFVLSVVGLVATKVEHGFTGFMADVLRQSPETEQMALLLDALYFSEDDTMVAYP
jgi:hypothetical protein